MQRTIAYNPRRTDSPARCNRAQALLVVCRVAVYPRLCRPVERSKSFISGRAEERRGGQSCYITLLRLSPPFEGMTGCGPASRSSCGESFNRERSGRLAGDPHKHGQIENLVAEIIAIHQQSHATNRE